MSAQEINAVPSAELAEENARLRREIARLRSVDQLLRNREQALHFILASSTDAIATIDENSIVLFANAGLRRVFGYAPKEVVNQPITMLMAEDQRESHRTGLRRFLRTGGRQQNWHAMRVRGRHRDGHEIPIELSIGAMRQTDGSFRLTGIMRDLTAQLQAEQRSRMQLSELARLQRLRSVSELATGLAHELNQPLAAICLQADAAAQLASRVDQPSSQELSAALQEIAGQAERASRIVRGVRNLVLRREPARDLLCINQLIQEIAPICEHYASRAEVTLELHLDKQLPQVRVERVLIEQVIVNLVQNAADAMQKTPDARRRIIIGTQCQDSATVTVSIRDHGVGLPAVSAQQIFDSFFTTKPDGLGLGLAICRSIVEDHGGRITAAPTDDGGAVFSFTIPTELLDDAHVH